MKEIDARGLSCPQPVVLVQQGIKSGETSFKVLLNSETSRENVSRLLLKNGFTIETGRTGDDTVLTAKK